MLKGFKDFILRGNVIDLAVAVVIGAAFTAIVTSIYWALLIVAYFLWSFLGEGWGISWIIWPVGGVLFGAIHTVVDTLETRRRKRSR